MGKVDTRTLPVAAVNERRRQAVKLRIGGAKLKEISRITELSPTTIIAAYMAYCEGGWKAVPVSAGGRSTGDGRTLTPEQEELIQAKICDHTPDQLKLEFALWNREAMRRVKSSLILDNLHVHHSLKLQQWLEGKADQIRIFYLPSYSPELNPDEMLNANLKQAVRSAAPARKKGDLKARALARMRHLSKSPAKVRAFFRHKTVRYAA
jgi:transposase